jgi:pimeloyl-ACP methyl ester carboxylesterase
MFVSDRGSGKTIVLLHGFCETHSVWNNLARRLSEHHRVLVPDLPGFGKSDLPPVPFSLDDVASVVLKNLTDRGIHSMVIFGHSLGGYVGLAMAQQAPERIDGIALVHSTALPDSEERKANRNRVIDFISNHGTEPFVRSFFQNLFTDPNHPALPELVHQALNLPAQTLTAYTLAMRDRPDRIPFLRGYRGKVWYIAGDKDQLIPMESVMEQVALLGPKAGVEVLRDTGHMGLIEKEEDIFQAMLRLMTLL